MNKEERGVGMKNFLIGVVAGFVLAAIIFGLVAGLVYYRNKEREVLDYVEEQQYIETLRQDYIDRDPFEFLDDVPGVRRSADDAIADFERRRDEILQRFRTGIDN